MAPKILFGTAGIPLSAKRRDSVSGVERVRELGLDAMELEFVRGVNMKPDLASRVKKTAGASRVSLSVHAPYYINLNSRDKQKTGASRQRIIDSARIGALAGARLVTFHPAYYQGSEKRDVFNKVKEQIQKILSELRAKKISIALAPETTGKPAQFGSLQELLALCGEINDLVPMVDFAHLHARDNGRFGKKEDFASALSEIESADPSFLKGLQMHASGIVFSEKGERNHVDLESRENTFNYKWFLESLKEFSASGTIICESPSIEGDALLMKKHYDSL